MKTAEEYAIEFAQNSNHSYTQVDNFQPHDWVVKAMIEFAKYHVQEALKEANRNAKIEHSGWESGHYWHHEISEDSILNAYPLENIK